MSTDWLSAAICDLLQAPRGKSLPRLGVFVVSAQVTSDFSVLVSPFRSLSPDPGDQNFCDGLTEEVVHKLAQDHRLRVITQSVAARLDEKGGHTPYCLLEATLRRDGADIRVTLHLMELTGGGSARFSNSYQSTINDIFATQERLAEEIRRDLTAALHIGNSGNESIH